MSNLEISIYLAIAWIPIIAIGAAIILFILGFFLKYKNKSCKKIIKFGLICLSITIAFYSIFFIIGMVGFGPRS
jgi:multisubunit Na+/H+ antiporter MnhC subunit